MVFNPLSKKDEAPVEEDIEEEEDEEEDEDRIQQLLDNRDRRVNSPIDFWSLKSSVDVPSMTLSFSEMRDILENENKIKKFTPEQQKIILQHVYNDLRRLFSSDVVLSFLTEKEIRIAQYALEFADDSWDLNKDLPVETQINIFKKFVRKAMLIIEFSRGRKGATVTAINSQHVSIERNSSNRSGAQKPNVFDSIIDRFRGGGGML